jgi:hypothetical protein
MFPRDIGSRAEVLRSGGKSCCDLITGGGAQRGPKSTIARGKHACGWSTSKDY